MDIEKPNCIGCHHIHADNGNCTAVGGFCTAVPAAYCPLIPELRAENAQLRAELEYEKEHANAYYEECGQWEAENEKLRETVDKYAKAARVIALHLKPFCDESLPYDEMIADAARKASDELEQVIAERGTLIEDFVDYVTDGVPNPAIFCKNRCNKCVDMRGWCTGKNCKGFYPSVASGQKEG